MPEQQNVTNIPSNRVEFIDSRTGLVSREWYRFFLNLFTLAGGGGNQITLDDLQVGPPPQPVTEGGGGGGSGTVTSVQVSGGTTGLTTSGGPITSSGTITMGGTLNVANGGTGATDAATARTNLSAAQSGANADITSMTGVTGGISTPDYIDFDTTAAPARATGRLWWDNADGIQTLNLGMAGTNATMQVGQESYYRIKASSAITEGQVVMFTGTVGASGALQGAPATGLTAATAQYVMGVATENIAHNGWGYVTEFGLVRGIDTSGGAEAWVDGQILYYDPTVAGGLTKTLPSAPNAKVVVAAVVYASASNGSLFIRPSFGGELGQYEGNVGFTSLSNGDLMQYDSGAGKWTNVPSSTFGTGSVTSVDTAGTVNGLTLTGGPITTSGTITLGGTLDLSSPPTIGNTTPSTGTFTTLIGGKDQVNYGQLTGGATTKAVEFKTLGSDTNVALALRSQGTGAIDLAAGSRGVNISNGGTVTAITGTAGGSYTTVPTVTISAPTTAGGVQATATAAMAALTLSVTSGGTGYAIGDTITLTGGTFSQAIVLTVATLSGSAVATVTTTNAGTYTALPTNPISQGSTSGAGTGATFTVSAWQVRTTAFTITNAGSGYVEQPTVSFSSGSAAAFAKVGDSVTVKSIHGSIAFTGPQNTLLNIADTGNTAQCYMNLQGSNSNTLNYANGSASNVGIYSISKGTGQHSFTTNGSTSTEQLRVTHTASAVNYVQVTGAATGNWPVISSQGSDSNSSLGLTAKGSGSLLFFTNNGSQRQFRVLHTASAVNYITATGGAAGAAPSFTSDGTDTNIDLTLTPKGTGVVRTSGTGIRLYGSSSGYVGLKGAAAAGSTTYTLPAADGTSGQVLSTDGAATLSWATPSGSSNITAQGMWENALTISSNYTITSGNSAMSAGPITVASGVTVTVPSGSRWVVV